MSLYLIPRIQFVKSGFYLHEFGAYILEARSDFLMVYYLLLACLKADACGLDGEPLLLDEVMNQAHHLNILLRILACSSSRLLRLECRNLLLPKPEGMFGYPNFCGHLTNRIVKFQILLHRLSQTPYRDSPPGVPSRRIARHQDP